MSRYTTQLTYRKIRSDNPQICDVYQSHPLPDGKYDYANREGKRPKAVVSRQGQGEPKTHFCSECVLAEFEKQKQNVEKYRQFLSSASTWNRNHYQIYYDEAIQAVERLDFLINKTNPARLTVSGIRELFSGV